MACKAHNLSPLAEVKTPVGEAQLVFFRLGREGWRFQPPSKNKLRKRAQGLNLRFFSVRAGWVRDRN